MENQFVLKGQICYSTGPESLVTAENSYLVCENGRSAGVFRELPQKYQAFPQKDWGDCLILPGLSDLHLHAPQYSFRSIGMDLELLEWLNTRTFPEEAKYRDLEYAEKAYEIFAESMKYSATTRACIFGTIHREATGLLMDRMEATGLKTLVGKVNMDRNSPEYLTEGSWETSAEETLRWLEEAEGRYQNVRPILTPRFIPSCSDRLLEELGRIQRATNLPVQSHLSENRGEIEWVRELCPWSRFYGDAYDRFGLFGSGGRAVMAHCVWSGEEELELIRERGVFIAHCPESNANLASGIAPVRAYLDRGLNLGLGTDIAGGTGESVFQAMTEAVRMSKLRWRLTDSDLRPLTVPEVFYLGTKGGGAFFGKTGSFEPGYELDAIVLEDGLLRHPQPLKLSERLERAIYLSDDRQIRAKYTAGRLLWKRDFTKIS